MCFGHALAASKSGPVLMKMWCLHSMYKYCHKLDHYYIAVHHWCKKLIPN